MKHAVTIRPAAGARQAIYALWRELEQADMHLGFDRTLFEPHITLAVVAIDDTQNHIVLPALENWCRRFAASLPRIPLHLSHLGLFPPSVEQGGVLFVGAAAHGPLGAAFHAFQAGLPAGCQVVRPLYTPAHWIPHITLAHSQDAQTLARAMQRALRTFQPLVTEAADLELYELLPVERILRIALGPCDCGRDKSRCDRCAYIRYPAQD